MFRFLFTFTLAFFSTDVFSQYHQGARLNAMGNASAAVHDVWSLNANPAGIVEEKQAVAAINYARYLFSDELSEQSFAFVLPMRSNFVGLSVNRYGISDFNEIKAGLALSKKFGNDLAIGVKTNLHQLKISRYGAATAFSIDVGLNYSLNRTLGFGLYVNNPSAQQYKADQIASSIPRIMHFGSTYTPSDQLLLAATVSKDFERSIDAAIGLAYQFDDRLSLRGGLSLKPFKQYAGLGLKLRQLLVDTAIEIHPQLGYTPQIGIAYAF